jgi:hypothetical protein
MAWTTLKMWLGIFKNQSVCGDKEKKISCLLQELSSDQPVHKMDLIGWGGMDSIYMAQDRDQCRALVNMVMNLHVP